MTKQKHSFFTSNFTSKKLQSLLAVTAFGLSASMYTHATTTERCSSGEGFTLGTFYTLFKVSLPSNNCMDIERNARDQTRHSVDFNWNGNGNGDDMVGGVGWASGTRNRTVNYRVNSWQAAENDNPGRNQFGDVTFGLYGWSCGSRIVEYYVVDRWARDAALVNGRKVPFDNSTGANTRSVGNARINGATYDLYVTTQINRPHGCGTGNRTFDQYWSIRRNIAGVNRDHTISFRQHVNAWSNSGLELGSRMGYQVLAPEGIGHSSGRIEYTLDR